MYDRSSEFENQLPTPSLLCVVTVVIIISTKANEEVDSYRELYLLGPDGHFRRKSEESINCFFRLVLGDKVS